jgi:N-acetylglutamate synthase-like GNAT family acetyltransferase
MIRQAEQADVDAITRIRESVTIDMGRLDDTDYAVNMQRQGFLFPSGPTQEQLIVELVDYRVVQRDQNIVGFYALHAEQEDLTSEQTGVSWLKPGLEESYFSLPHALLSSVSVESGVRHRGIATEMLEDAEQQARGRGASHLFAFVALTPVTNFASMMFHEKNGFDRAATSSPHLFVADNGFQVEGYQFFLYGKHLYKA